MAAVTLTPTQSTIAATSRSGPPPSGSAPGPTGGSGGGEAEEEEEAAEEEEEEEDQLNPRSPNQRPPLKEMENWKGKNLPFSMVIERKPMNSYTNSNSTNSSTPPRQS